MRAAYRESLLRTRVCSRWWFKMRQLWCSFLGVTIDAHYPATFACSCLRFPQPKKNVCVHPQALNKRLRTEYLDKVKVRKSASTNINYKADFKIFKVLSKKHSVHTLSSFFSGPLKYPRLCTATGSWNATCRNLADHVCVYKYLCVHVCVKCTYIHS